MNTSKITSTNKPKPSSKKGLIVKSKAKSGTVEGGYEVWKQGFRGLDGIRGFMH